MTSRRELRDNFCKVTSACIKQLIPVDIRMVQKEISDNGVRKIEIKVWGKRAILQDLDHRYMGVLRSSRDDMADSSDYFGLGTAQAMVARKVLCAKYYHIFPSTLFILSSFPLYSHITRACMYGCFETSYGYSHVTMTISIYKAQTSFSMPQLGVPSFPS